MKLSAIKSITPAMVVREAEFASLGFVTHSSSRLLVFIENEKFIAALSANPQISSVLTTPELVDLIPDSIGVAVLENPRRSFYEFHNYLAKNTEFYGKPFASQISKLAKIHSSAIISENSVEIGDDVIIEPNVVIKAGTTIGDGCVIRAGVTIGMEGFEFKRFGEEIYYIEHAGGAHIGKRVEIQSNSNVDRSVFGRPTVIGNDSKIDTMVHVAHHVIVGKRCLIAALTVLGGSCVIGDDVWIGPQCSISSNVKVGDQAYVTIGSVVTRDVAPEQHVTGNFAIDHERFLTFIKSIR